MRVAYLNRPNIVMRDNHTRAALREVKESNGKVIFQANAAVRRRISRQVAGMQRDPRPGDALHIGHGGSAINIRTMPFFLTDDAEYAERRWMTGNSRRYGRACDQCPIVIKRDPLISYRDNDL